MTGNQNPKEYFMRLEIQVNFFSVGKMFLGEEIKEVIKVDLEI